MFLVTLRVLCGPTVILNVMKDQNLLERLQKCRLKCLNSFTVKVQTEWLKEWNSIE